VVRLTDEIALDFAAGEKLVAIEVLDASRLFEKPGVLVIELKDLRPVVLPAKRKGAVKVPRGPGFKWNT